MANGIGLAAMVTRSPSWANGERPPNWAPNPIAYGDFVFAASRRYPAIRKWMIWGEPTRFANFRPVRVPKGPRRYAEILDRAYGALKSVNPRNVVIGAMTFSGGDVLPRETIRWMRLKNGRPPRMDLWGHNPFDARFPHLSDPPQEGLRGFNDLDTLHAEIARDYRRAGRPVPGFWLSEWNPFIGNWKGQAVRLKAAYTIASRTPYIAGLGWFTLLDTGSDPLVTGLGLLDSDGNPKPGYYAYKAIP